MAKIPTIKLTSHELQTIIDENAVNFGGESIILKSPTSETLYKIFNYNSSFSPEFAYPNKQKKLQNFYDLPNLQYSVKPLSLISADSSFVGYEMTLDPLDITLSDALLTPEQKIAYLHQVKKILEYYHKNGIIYGDVRGDNILINMATQVAKFCDMDNAQIGTHPIDVMVPTLTEYKDARDGIDFAADSYMFNLLTLEQLTYPEESYEDILNRISCGIYPHNFTKEAHAILESMTVPQEYQGETIIQYLKK